MNRTFSCRATDEGRVVFLRHLSFLVLLSALGQNFVLAKYNIVRYICSASLLSAWYVQEGGTVYDRPRFTGCARKKRMDAGRNGGKAGGHPGLSFDAGEWPPLDA